MYEKKWKKILHSVIRARQDKARGDGAEEID